METRANGTRYINYKLWNKTKNEPYDYENKGLLKRLMSRVIVESENQVTQTILNYYEKSLIFLMKYVDELKNFKNYHWKNR